MPGGGRGNAQDGNGGNIPEGGFGRDMRQNGVMQGFDMQAMQRAMEILQAAGDGELTQEQQGELNELGLTEEQIESLRSMTQGGFPGNFSGGAAPDAGGAAARPGGAPQGNMQGDTQNGMNNMPSRGNQAFVGAQPTATAGYDSASWMVLGGCTVLLLGALMFVLFFKRRRA